VGQKFLEFSQAVQRESVPAGLLDLVNIRASQINGCAFCLDMHVKEAKIRGERELRLHHVAIWRESPLFSSKERAALEWTEALTQIAGNDISGNCSIG
jgi:AhpD family alkylhydroperoxidase